MQVEPRDVAPSDLDGTFRAVLERVPGAVYVQRGDGDAITTYISPRAEELLGRPADELVGSGDAWAALTHPDDHAAVRVADAQADLDGVFHCEYRLRTADGGYRWFRDEAYRYPSDDGVALWIGVLVDIHDLKEAEQGLRVMESRYRNLVEQLPATTHVHALDGELSTLYLSPQIEQLLGFDAERRTTANLWPDYVLRADRDHVLRETLAGAASDQPFTLEYRMVRSDGHVIYVQDAARWCTTLRVGRMWFKGSTPISRRRNTESANSRRRCSDSRRLPSRSRRSPISSRSTGLCGPRT
jgi:PAS domain S-box-containing protein